MTQEQREKWEKLYKTQEKLVKYCDEGNENGVDETLKELNRVWAEYTEAKQRSVNN